jgi:plasmid stabilization system protein ParE
VKRSIHPLAQHELIDGAVFYATRDTAALGERFVAEFERPVSLLQTHPELGAVWRGKYRRLPLCRFPYNIVDVMSEDALQVLAVAHQRRKPGCWRGRG